MELANKEYETFFGKYVQGFKEKTNKKQNKTMKI